MKSQRSHLYVRFGATQTEEIDVLATLESGVSENNHRISVASFSDGKQFYDINLDLSVKS